MCGHVSVVPLLVTSGGGWGFSPLHGRVRRLTRDADGREDRNGPPPEGYPASSYSGSEEQGAHDYASSDHSDDYHGRYSCSTVKVMWDADEGTLRFQVNTGACMFNITYSRRFPSGVAVRPWAAAYGRTGDQLTIRGWA